MSKDYDPPMHTAEHVLNQTMVRMFGCDRSYSSHLNKGKSKCDYHFPRNLEKAEAAELEEKINAVLHQNLPVTISFLPRAEAEKKVKLTKLPTAIASQQDITIRMVAVGDYDLCPCIGQHVSNTADVGTFRIISWEFTPAEEFHDPDAPEMGRLRLRFKLIDPKNDPGKEKN